MRQPWPARRSARRPPVANTRGARNRHRPSGRGLGVSIVPGDGMPFPGTFSIIAKRLPDGGRATGRCRCHPRRPPASIPTARPQPASGPRRRPSGTGAGRQCRYPRRSGRGQYAAPGQISLRWRLPITVHGSPLSIYGDARCPRLAWPPALRLPRQHRTPGSGHTGTIVTCPPRRDNTLRHTRRTATRRTTSRTEGRPWAAGPSAGMSVRPFGPRSHRQWLPADPVPRRRARRSMPRSRL